MTKHSPSQAMTKVQIRLPDGLRDDLKALAIARHRSIANLATMVLTEYVKSEKTASNPTA
ncbi:hypothetical protein ACFSUK_28750 [Sphingobium scionense]|uniref:Plasmid stability protein n=1 Tax=Sphingobium scionense TaxID=1404341 RepID=A0A7W6LPA0_9SPHN|nr:hypothetical protein [Sphingobium scionense]MBB4147999.1 plasmid stability protein [Sphingobium scionense]